MPAPSQVADGNAEALYSQLARQVVELIERGTLRSGERLPSVRELARERKVSVATVLAAYQQLEREDHIEVRPKSGHFVRRRPVETPQMRRTRAPLQPARVSVSAGVSALLAALRDSAVVPLGAVSLAPELYAVRDLNRTLSSIAREVTHAGATYEVPPGLLTLRRQLARRSLTWGVPLDENDFCITVGAMEALHLALRATTRPGQTVAVSSPMYFGVLQLIEELGLRVLEIPCDPEQGMDLDVLERALSHSSAIKACLAIPTFDNPLGALMPQAARARLVWLLARHDVPLIEDDIYGDLAWDGSRPVPAKAHDRDGRVLLCGSTSKTLAAGYRVGWLVPGRYSERVQRLKFSHTVASPTLEQMAIAEYLASGRYDRHLRTLRGRLAAQVKTFRDAISAAFPRGTRISDPKGSYVLWIELPRGTDSLKMQMAALSRGVAIAPGPIFSARQRYLNCIRINCGFPWSRRMEQAIALLGELAHGC
ncbi:MAG TPA: PLP-dependent aminotransferase family protein [Polyangia bacterium]